MKYEDVLAISRQKLRDALASKSDDRAAKAIIAIALHDPDWTWAEQQCLAALHDRRQEVRAAAIIGLGHIARIHRKSTLSSVIPALEALRSDEDLGGMVGDALEDIIMFVQTDGSR